MNPRQLLLGARNEIGQELALYRSLARWIARRPDVPADAVPIGYARLSGPMLWLWIFGSTTEVVVVEVVLRSIEARWAEVIRLPCSSWASGACSGCSASSRRTRSGPTSSPPATC